MEYDFMLDNNGSLDKNAVFVQSEPAAVWIVTHSLNKFPSVTVIDSNNQDVDGDVRYQDRNTVVLTFSGAFSGTAVLN